MPVWPAITAGVQPPLGVTDTAQPLSSAASTLVVPNRNVRSNSAMDTGGCAGILLCHASRYERYGFFPPSNGYGSPGRMSGSLRSERTSFARSRAYSFDRRPFTGGAGVYAVSP